MKVYNNEPINKALKDLLDNSVTGTEPLPEIYVENGRIVEVPELNDYANRKAREIFQHYVSAGVTRGYPFGDHKFRFLLSDRMDISGYIMRGKNVSIICISKGICELYRNEMKADIDFEKGILIPSQENIGVRVSKDLPAEGIIESMFLHTLMHELSHKLWDLEHPGVTQKNKVAEVHADMRPLGYMNSSGHSILPAMQLMTRLGIIEGKFANPPKKTQEQSKWDWQINGSLPKWAKIFADPHMEGDNRSESVRYKAIKEMQVTEPAPIRQLDPALENAIKDAKHVAYYDTHIPENFAAKGLSDKLKWIRDEFRKIPPGYDERIVFLLEKIEECKIDPNNRAHGPALKIVDEIADIMLDDPYVFNNYYKRLELIIDAVPLGTKLIKLANLVQAFMDVRVTGENSNRDHEIQVCEVAAKAVIDYLSTLKPLQCDLRIVGGIPNYQLPYIEKMIEATKRAISYSPPWGEKLRLAEVCAERNNGISHAGQLLLMLGHEKFDHRLLKFIPPEILVDLDNKYMGGGEDIYGVVSSVMRGVEEKFPNLRYAKTPKYKSKNKEKRAPKCYIDINGAQIVLIVKKLEYGYTENNSINDLKSYLYAQKRTLTAEKRKSEKPDNVIPVQTTTVFDTDDSGFYKNYSNLFDQGLEALMPIDCRPDKTGGYHSSVVTHINNMRSFGNNLKILLEKKGPRNDPRRYIDFVRGVFLGRSDKKDLTFVHYSNFGSGFSFSGYPLARVICSSPHFTLEEKGAFLNLMRQQLDRAPESDQVETAAETEAKERQEKVEKAYQAEKNIEGDPGMAFDFDNNKYLEEIISTGGVLSEREEQEDAAIKYETHYFQEQEAVILLAVNHKNPKNFSELLEALQKARRFINGANNTEKYLSGYKVRQLTGIDEENVLDDVGKDIINKFIAKHGVQHLKITDLILKYPDFLAGAYNDQGGAGDKRAERADAILRALRIYKLPGQEIEHSFDYRYQNDFEALYKNRVDDLFSSDAEPEDDFEAKLIIEIQSEIMAKHGRADGTENWPMPSRDALIKIYKFLQDTETFRDNYEKEQFAECIKNDINQIKSPNSRVKLCEELLGGAVVKDPKLRRDVIDIWCKSMLENHGPDDNTPTYRKIFVPVLKRLKKTVSYPIRESMLVLLAEELKAQSRLSYQFEASLSNASQKDIDNLSLGMAGAEVVFDATKRSNEIREDLLGYLYAREMNQDINKRLAETIVLLQQINDETTEYALYDRENEKYSAELYFSVLLKTMHENFWQGSLELRAVALDQLLLNPDERNKDELSGDKKYFNNAFGKVLQRLVPLEDGAKKPISYAQESRVIIRSYVDNIAPIERSVFLAGALSADSNVSERDRSAGLTAAAALPRLLERGILETKFGQGLNNLKLSEDPHLRNLGKGCEHLKDNANPSKRWDTWHRIQSEDALWKMFENGSFLGDRLGSGSVQEAFRMRKGKGKNAKKMVLTIEREGAEYVINRGEKCLNGMANDLAKQTDSAAIQDVASYLKPVIRRAAVRSKNEVNRDGNTQRSLLLANRLEGFEVKLPNKKTYTFGVAKIAAVGNIFTIQDEIAGVQPKDIKDKKYAWEVALATVTASWYLKLCGDMRPDHDWHDAQAKVNKNFIGRFDPGGVQLNEPTKEEKQQFAQALINIFAAVGSSVTEESAGSAMQKLNKAMDNEIKWVEQSSGGKSPDYLYDLQAGIVADSNYMRLLKFDEIKAAITACYLSGEMNQELLNSTVQIPFLGAKKFDDVLALYLPKESPIKIIPRKGKNVIPEPIDYRQSKKTASPDKETHPAAPNGEAHDVENGISEYSEISFVLKTKAQKGPVLRLKPSSNVVGLQY